MHFYYNLKHLKLSHNHLSIKEKINRFLKIVNLLGWDGEMTCKKIQKKKKKCLKVSTTLEVKTKRLTKAKSTKEQEILRRKKMKHRR